MAEPVGQRDHLQRPPLQHRPDGGGTKDLAALSDDALIFGACFLSSPNHKLSFGGDCAEHKITYRARAALDELIKAGVAVEISGEDSRPHREHYRGSTPIGPELQKRKLDPFSNDPRWNWSFFTPSGGSK